MKKILSIILAIILASTMTFPAFATAPSTPDCITVTVDSSSATSFFSRVINSIIALFQNLFGWLFGINNPEPPISDDPPEEPLPQPPEHLPITAEDPNGEIPNGFPISGSLDHSATTREVAYELIYDNFKDTAGFNPGTKYTVNETNNPKVNKIVNFILENNCGDALVYIGISEVSESGTKVNICPDALVTGKFLEDILFSIPFVSQLVVLNDDPYAPLSKEQVEFIVKYAVLYTRFRNGELINSNGTLTRKEAYEIFQNVFSDAKKTLVIPDPDKLANIEFLDYLAMKFSGSVASHRFGDEPHLPVTPAEVQFIAELNHLMMYDQIVAYQATIVE